MQHTTSQEMLKRRFIIALIAMLITFVSICAATFAWYIFHVSKHTTNVHMAAGSSISLQISNQENGTYSSSAVLDSFVGELNPVSTDRIANGFQKVYGFTNGSENQPMLVANLFGVSDSTDYYKTNLYLKANGGNMDVYLADIGYEDSDTAKPISTAIRLGLVVDGQEFIYAINTAEAPQREYNSQKGEEGYVLDSTQTDGSVVLFTPMDSSTFCNMDSVTGRIHLTDTSAKLFTATEKPVHVEIYIWLEGCDSDCTNELVRTTLKNLSISFAGVTQ